MKITVKENVVTIEVSYYVPWGSTWTSKFVHTCANNHEAEMMVAILREDFETKMKSIRAKSYEQGWKDKSSKNPKETWHASSLPE